MDGQPSNPQANPVMLPSSDQMKSRSGASLWDRGVQFLRLKVTELNIDRLGKLATIIGVIISMLVFVFGQKFPLQMAFAEHLHKTVLPQQRISLSYIYTCIVENDGNSPAEDIVVTIRSEPSVVLEEFDVIDTQNLWRLQSGGKGSDHITIGLSRLHSEQLLQVTVTTKTPIQVSCIASSKGSQASAQAKTVLTSLQIGDFVIMSGIQIAITLLLVLAMRGTIWLGLPGNRMK